MKNRKTRAFSLIELIVVIAVIAVIASVIIPNISGTNKAAKLQNAISAAATLNLAQLQYRLEKGALSWDELVAGGDDEACYDALTPYLEFSESWADFCDRYDGYSFTFMPLDDNGKMQKVVLTNDESGDTVSY